jgi:hypothetical protein
VVLDHRFAAGDDTGDTGGVRERIAVWLDDERQVPGFSPAPLRLPDGQP